MVFCRECQRKVEDCPHFVPPVEARRVRVFDEKVVSLAYVADRRILEIAFKSGQVWQLREVPDGIYRELHNSTISSFLKFIAHRYKASPVRTGVHAIVVPASEPCPNCKTAMNPSNKTQNTVANFVRVFWHCPQCRKSKWETYGSIPEREKRSRWH